MSCQNRSPGSPLSDNQMGHHSEYFSYVNNSYATTVSSLMGLFGPTLLLPLGKNIALYGAVERACALQSGEGSGEGDGKWELEWEAVG